MRFLNIRRGVLAVALLMLHSIAFADARQLSSEAQKGRYLAIAGNCATCHTAEGGAPFAGGVAFPTPFGTLYSTNITQDVETGLGSWSLKDFRDAIRKGVRPNGEHLYPAFPYPSYTRLSDRDIASLYAYIKTIAAVRAPSKDNELKFPFGWRALMRVWNALFLEEGAYVPAADRSAQWNRGAYLVRGLGHCGMCHSPRNFLGAEDHGELALSGGTYSDRISDGTYRQWAAVNLTPSKDGLAAWSANDIVAYLKTGVSGWATTFGPMNDVVMNSTRHLDESDLRAMATYLKALPARTQGVGSAPDEATMRAGETVYTVHCGTCHLPSGRGAEGMGTPLAGSAVVQAADPSSLINIILYGPQLPPAPFSSGRDPMEPFGDKLTDDETAQLATYIRASWGNAAGAVAAAQVAEQR